MIKGLKSFYHAPLGEDEKYTKAPSKLAGAMSFSDSIETAEAEAYVDDELQEYDYSVVGGTITLGIDDDDDTVFAPLMGETTAEKTITPEGEGAQAITFKEVKSNTGDKAISVGFGYITVKSVKNVTEYRVIFYHKVTFKPINRNANTKQKTLEFQGTSVEGRIQTLSNGDWRLRATFDDKAVALQYLQSLFVQSAGT